MKKDLSDLKFKDLIIKNPCSANWHEMDAETGGRFCRSCQKQVIDFTDKTEEELRAIVAASDSKLCGRFRKAQIGEHVPVSKSRLGKGRSNFLKKAAATAATLAIMQTSVQASEPPAKPKVEFNDKAGVQHPESSPNQVVTGVVLTTDGDNIPDDIVVKLMYYSKDGRKTIQQVTNAGLFHFDLAGKARPGSPITVIVPAQTLKEGHREHKYAAGRQNASLSEGQNLTMSVEASGLWDDMILGDIGFIEDEF